MRIVVIGGRGNSGTRICRALASDSDAEVIGTGHRKRTTTSTVPIDSVAYAELPLESPDFPQRLRALAPDIVIHCAGPYQGQDYRVASACIEAGSHYIDIADGRDFVSRFADAMHRRAEAAKVLAVTGASSVPALSAAVVDTLSKRLQTLESIHVCIAPAQQAPRGAATIAGVFSYAGRPMTWLSDGRWQKTYGWQSLRRIYFRNMGARMAAACDVPDIELFPHRYPSVRTVEFRAALEMRVEHYALWLCAALRRIGAPLPIERWAGSLNYLAKRFDHLGSRRGGMLVSITGRKADATKACIDWELTADDNHGPEIPCMAAILLARKLMRGDPATRGALPCMGLLTLEDFTPEFKRWNITTRIDETALA